MIALDTNVLARALVAFEGEQSRLAVDLLRRAAESGEQLYVSDVVVCELAWVLGSAYGFKWPQVAAAIRGLLGSSELTFRDAAALERAVSELEQGHGGLADHVIREQAVAAGCTAVATFDKALLKLPGFVSP